MASPGAGSEAMLARMTVVSVALQALVGRLVSNGTLNRADLLAMRETRRKLATDPRAHSLASAQVAGDQRNGDMAACWCMADSGSGM